MKNYEISSHAVFFCLFCVPLFFFFCNVHHRDHFFIHCIEYWYWFWYWYRSLIWIFAAVVDMVLVFDRAESHQCVYSTYIMIISYTGLVAAIHYRSTMPLTLIYALYTAHTECIIALTVTILADNVTLEFRFVSIQFNWDEQRAMHIQHVHCTHLLSLGKLIIFSFQIQFKI